MKVKDIIKDEKFNEFLGYEIEAYNNRPQPKEGYAYLLHNTAFGVRYCNFKDNLKEGWRRIKRAIGYAARQIWYWIAARTAGRLITK